MSKMQSSCTDKLLVQSSLELCFGECTYELAEQAGSFHMEVLINHFPQDLNQKKAYHVTNHLA